MASPPVDVRAGPCMNRIQFADDEGFFERLLARSDKFEEDGAHRAASELRRELVVELLDQLNTRDEARNMERAEKLTRAMRGIRDQIDIGQAG